MKPAGLVAAGLHVTANKPGPHALVGVVTDGNAVRDYSCHDGLSVASH